MYDDFMSGYTGRAPQLRVDPRASSRSFSISGQQQASQDKKIRQQEISGTYDKSKFTRMRGPAGEQGEIYANGKMYIIAGPGQTQVRTFPSRPYGVKYMQKKGWVLA